GLAPAAPLALQEAVPNPLPQGFQKTHGAAPPWAGRFLVCASAARPGRPGASALPRTPVWRIVRPRRPGPAEAFFSTNGAPLMARRLPRVHCELGPVLVNRTAVYQMCRAAPGELAARGFRVRSSALLARLGGDAEPAGPREGRLFARSRRWLDWA